MRLDSKIAEVLAKVNGQYEEFRNSDGSLYVKLKRPIYGLVQSALRWNEEISRTLRDMGYTQNPYDPCVWNKGRHDDQCTVLIHVDDLMITCKRNSTINQLIQHLKVKYDNDLTVTTGDIHSYLGITFDFSVEGQVRLSQKKYVDDLISETGTTGTVLTPALDNLFVLDHSAEKLNGEDTKAFHTVVAKILYLAKRTRPDLLVAVSHLVTRVQAPTSQDKQKLERVLKYVNGTKELYLTLRSNDQIIQIFAFIDASYGVHADGKSHTGIVIVVNDGTVFFQSSKQKLNTKSSTESELVGLSDGLSQVIWTRNFLIAQGYDMGPAKVFQDNLSTMRMVKNGRSTSQRTRHVHIRFFFVKDRVDKREIAIEYKPTDHMLADILTKPLQGQHFINLRAQLLRSD